MNYGIGSQFPSLLCFAFYLLSLVYDFAGPDGQGFLPMGIFEATRNRKRHTK
jgi:hypothetical protein